MLAALALAGCGAPPRTAPDSQVGLVRTRQIALSSQPARELAFSPDGLLLATSAADGTVALWPTRQRGRPKIFHAPPVASLALSPDGSAVAVGCYDGSLRVWRIADGAQLLARAFGGGTQWSVAFSPDGRRVAAGGEDKILRIWTIADGRLVHTLRGHRLNIWKVVFSPDGRTLATSSFDHDIRLWDPATGAAIRTLAGHAEAVVGLAFSPDGALLASGSDDSTVRLWRVADGAPLRTIAAGNHVYSVAFSRDGRTLATAGRARGGLGTFLHQLTGGIAPGANVRLWRVRDGALLAAAPEAEDAMFVAWAPDGGWLATATEGGTASLWRLVPRRGAGGAAS